MLKNINLTVLLSLAGVLIGWILSEASSILRGRREQRKIFGQGVLRLLQLREIVDREIYRLDVAKGLQDRDKLDDRHRELLATQRLGELQQFFDNGNEALSEISSIDPFLSYELDRKIRAMTHVLDVSGAYADKQPKDELNQMWDHALIGAEGIAMKQVIADIDKLILRLARRKGIAAAVRARFYFFKHNRMKRRYPNSRMVEYLGLMDEMNETLASEINQGPTSTTSKKMIIPSGSRGLKTTGQLF